MQKILEFEGDFYRIEYKDESLKEVDSCIFCDFAEGVTKGYVICRLEKKIGTTEIVKSSCYDEEGCFFKKIKF